MRYRVSLVFALLIAVLSVVFALQNTVPIRVQLGPFLLESSTALILIITFILGVTTGILGLLPGKLRQRKRVRSLKRQITDQDSDDALSSELETDSMNAVAERPEAVPSKTSSADQSGSSEWRPQ